MRELQKQPADAKTAAGIRTFIGDTVVGRLKEALKSIYRIVLKRRARSALSRIRRIPADSAGRLAKAIGAALDDDADPEERVWIERIESLRGRLSSSSTEISVVIYGVASPDLNLTAEDMYRGMTIRKTIGNICKDASKPYLWAFLLFKLVREFAPSLCLELGTCLGISTAYQAAALKLNGGGRIVTMEGAEPLAALARRNFQELDLDNIVIVFGRFQDTLTPTLENHGPIDFAFIDGHHDENATVDYFKRMCPFLAERAVLIFDDIAWSDGMKRAWRTIQANERVKIAVDMKEIGICVIDDGIEGKRRYRIETI